MSDPRAFLIDFLPILRRRVTREGIRADHIAYYSDALRPFIAARESLPSFVIRRDPRDLSRIFLLDPDDSAYIEVPCARQERPSITLFEHRQAVARLKAEGLAQVDEDAIFRAVAEQRDIAQAAAARTRSARRRIARTDRELGPPPSRPVSTPANLSREQKSDDSLVVVTQLYPVTPW